MPVTCRLLDPFPGWDAIQPGDMWAYGVEEWGESADALRARFRDLAPEYFRDNYARRPPLLVCMPNGDPFRLDTVSSMKQTGWVVTGDPPAITVEPSIHLVGFYHGFLRAGVFTDDPAMVAVDPATGA